MKKFTMSAVCALTFLLVCALSSKGQWQKTSAAFGNVDSVWCIATNGKNIYAGTNLGGVYVSTNNGGTWSAPNTGLTNHTVYALAVSGSNIFAGTFGGGVFLSTDNGNTWTSKSDSNLTSNEYIHSLAVMGSYIYAATDNDGIFLSKDNGTTWAPVDSGLPNTRIISIIAHGSKLLAGSLYGGIYISVDSGQVWGATGLAGSEIHSFAFLDNANVFAGSRKTGIYFSPDTGKAWLSVSSSALADSTIEGLVAIGSSILAASDGYKAGTGGVYISPDTGNVWLGFDSTGLTNKHITALAANGDSIFAGTKDGQIWKRAVADVSNCSPYITASGATTFCEGDSVILTSNYGSAYLWSTGESTQSIVVRDSGFYTCLVTSYCGMLTSNSISVKVKLLPLAIIQADGPLTFCLGDSVHLTAVGSPYIWNTGSTALTLVINNNSRIKIVTLTVIGNNGCNGTATDTVNVIKPTISSEPGSDSTVVHCPAMFTVGDTVSNLTYQWQCNAGSGYSNLVDGAAYSGVNTDTLVVNDPFLSMNNYSYRVAVNNQGCTQISGADTLNVTPVKTPVITATLCKGDSVVIGPFVHKTTGIYVDSLLTINGCDSLIFTTNLTIDTVKKTTQSLTICKGDSITIGTHVHSTSGTYTDSLTVGAGCDSIVITTLSVVYIKTSDSLTVCKGDTITVGTHKYASSGIYTDSLISGSGCDSIVTNKITFVTVDSVKQSITICYGTSLKVGTTVHDTSGTFRDTISTIACDSIVITKLTVNPIIKTSQAMTICAGDSIIVGTYVHHTTGTFSDTLKTSGSCDSLVITTLKVRAPIDSVQNVTICNGNSLIVGDSIYTTSATYHNILMSVTGCDSSVTTNLVVANSVTDSAATKLCFGDTLFIGSNAYTAPGTYPDTLIPRIQCDSIVMIHLTFVDTSVSVAKNGDTLIANEPGATYKWISCEDNADKTIAYAITQTFFPLDTGLYQVVITAHGCSPDTSRCLHLTNVGFQENILSYFISLFPNPANDILYIHSSSALNSKELTISVINVFGETVQVEKQKWMRDVSLNINKLPAGMYFLEMKTENWNVVKRFVKE